jgi:endonuclease III related protein
LNVEKALINLKSIGVLDARKLLLIDCEKLKLAIKPAGYFNQKARKL